MINATKICPNCGKIFPSVTEVETQKCPQCGEQISFPTPVEPTTKPARISNISTLLLVIAPTILVVVTSAFKALNDWTFFFYLIFNPIWSIFVGIFILKRSGRGTVVVIIGGFFLGVGICILNWILGGFGCELLGNGMKS